MSTSLSMKEDEFFSSGWPTDWFDWTKWSWEVNPRLMKLLVFCILMLGEVRIDGLSLPEAPTDYRKKIGYIPETPSLYEELTLRRAYRDRSYGL